MKRGFFEKKDIVFFGFAAIIIAFVFYLSFNASGKVVLDIGESYGLGEKLGGKLSLVIQEGDKIGKDSLIEIMLVKDSIIIISKNLSVEEFINGQANYSTLQEEVSVCDESSGERVCTKGVNLEYIYDVPGSYSREISDLIDYTFSNAGDYVLSIELGDLNVKNEKSFSVASNEAAENIDNGKKGIESYSVQSTPGNVSQCIDLDTAGTYVLNTSISASGHCFNITSNNVTLDGNGYKITGSNVGYGIRMTGTRDNVTIKNLVITNFNEGIRLISATNFSIVNNTIINNGGGFYFSSVNGSVIANNSIINNTGGGIQFQCGSNNIITGNLISNISSYYGFVSSCTGFGTFDNNNISYNTIKYITNYAGISPQTRSMNNIIEGNNVSFTGHAFYLHTASENTIKNNNFSDSTGDGIWIINSHNNTFTNNVLTNSTLEGVYIQGGTNNTISGMTIDSSGQDAIYIIGSSQRNRFVNVTVTNTDSGWNDINFASDQNNETYLIDTRLGSYILSSAEGSIIYFEDSSYGKIRFLGLINGSGANLSDDVRIGNNLVYVNSSQLGLNMSANVTLYNVPVFTNPKIFMDGIYECNSTTNPSCSNFTALTGVVEFNVSAWSNYSIGGVAFCGNSICESGESCSSCVADCGSCPLPPSGGGGVTPPPPVVPPCEPNYVCSSWSKCIKGNMSRVCEDTLCGEPSKVEVEGCIILCTPKWECTAWSACSNGLSSRRCSDANVCDNAVGKPSESLSCNPDIPKDCTPKIECSNWGGCDYTGSAEDILLGQIKYTGTKERVCKDLNGCISSYSESGVCKSEIRVEVIEQEICGEKVLTVRNADTKEPLSNVNADKWKAGKLNIGFVQNESGYCPHCYNGVQDSGEEEIDCGGECKKCAEVSVTALGIEGLRERYEQGQVGWILIFLGIIFLVLAILGALRVFRGKIWGIFEKRDDKYENKFLPLVEEAKKLVEKGEHKKAKKIIDRLWVRHNLLNSEHRVGAEKLLNDIGWKIKKFEFEH